MESVDRLLIWLRDSNGWPLPDLEPESLTFSYDKTEIQFLRNELVQVCRVLQLRPLRDLTDTVFIIDQGDDDLSRFVVRRAAIHFSTRPTKRASREYVLLDRMTFFVLSSNGQLSVARFRGESALRAEMAVFGPFSLSAAHELRPLLSWENVVRQGLDLSDSLYIRNTRDRNKLVCSRRAIQAISPASLPLYDLANQVEMVSQIEEDRLFEYARCGEVWAFDRLVIQNLSLAFDVAYRTYMAYRELHIVFEDILGRAIDGLHRAVEKYDWGRGHRFASYAWPWVASRADYAVADALWPVRLPHYIWDRLRTPLRDYLQGFATTDDQFIRFLAWETFDLDCGDALEEVPDTQWETLFLEFEERNSIPDFLSGLRPREQEVMRMRLGLHPCAWGRVLTLQEIGDVMNITRERVRQIELTGRLRLLKQGGGASTADAVEALIKD